MSLCIPILIRCVPETRNRLRLCEEYCQCLFSLGQIIGRITVPVEYDLLFFIRYLVHFCRNVKFGCGDRTVFVEGRVIDNGLYRSFLI